MSNLFLLFESQVAQKDVKKVNWVVFAVQNNIPFYDILIVKAVTQIKAFVNWPAAGNLQAGHTVYLLYSISM